jgi:integrase
LAGVQWSPVKRGRATVPGVYTRTDERGRVRYRAVWWGPDPNAPGKRKQYAETFDRLNDAIARREEESDRQRRGKWVAPARSKVTLRQLREEVNAKEAYAEATLARDAWTWKHVEDANLADRPVSTIGKADVDKLLGKLRNRPETARKVRVLISKLFDHAIDTDQASANPATHRRKSKTRAARMQASRGASAPRHLTEKELARLLDELPERDRAFVELMARVGLRPGEAHALTVGKFDPLRRTLTIDTSLTGFTKTGEARTLTLPAVVAEMLAEHISRFSDPADPDAPMFPKEDGSAITTKNAQDAWRRRHFAPAAERAGINNGFSPNDLRHSAAAFAIEHGANVYHVQRMLGHAKPSITLDVYGSLWDDSAEQLAERLDTAIRAGRVPIQNAEIVPLPAGGKS